MNVFSGVALLLLGSSMLLYAEGTKCTGGFHKHGNSCYWLSNIKGTFAEARSICRFLGSDLVAITSHTEDAFVRGYATQRGKAERYYLGGTDLGLEGRWIWTGNKPFTYTNWEPGQPTNYKNNEHCLEAYKEITYNTIHRENSHIVIQLWETSKYIKHNF
ncbi:perlucin-like [Haliotis rufescens]|uniref:perlucin-like n=1 Tax=Haliotis rufescens TaxID=6454 RepID=UPI00201EC7C4|nr:perlucin-like [Haliotis rufescens]